MQMEVFVKINELMVAACAVCTLIEIKGKYCSIWTGFNTMNEYLTHIFHMDFTILWLFGLG